MSYETDSVQICEVFAGESHDCPGHIFMEASLHHQIKVKNVIVTFYLKILTWYAKKYKLKIASKSEFWITLS